MNRCVAPDCGRRPRPYHVFCEGHLTEPIDRRDDWLLAHLRRLRAIDEAIEREPVLVD